MGASGSTSTVAVGGADLDEADFFGIGVEAVGLGVEREPLGGAEFRQQRREFCIVVNHVGNNLANRRAKEKVLRFSNEKKRPPGRTAFDFHKKRGGLRF